MSRFVKSVMPVFLNCAFTARAHRVIEQRKLPMRLTCDLKGCVLYYADVSVSYCGGDTVDSIYSPRLIVGQGVQCELVAK